MGHNAMTSDVWFRFRFRNRSQHENRGLFRLFQITMNRRFDFRFVICGVYLAKLDYFHEDDVTSRDVTWDQKLVLGGFRTFASGINSYLGRAARYRQAVNGIFLPVLPPTSGSLVDSSISNIAGDTALWSFFGRLLRCAFAFWATATKIESNLRQDICYVSRKFQPDRCRDGRDIASPVG